MDLVCKNTQLFSIYTSRTRRVRGLYSTARTCSFRSSNNSLFEDFCEFGLGMALGNKKMKERVAKLRYQSYIRKTQEHWSAE